MKYKYIDAAFFPPTCRLTELGNALLKQSLGIPMSKRLETMGYCGRPYFVQDNARVTLATSLLTACGRLLRLNFDDDKETVWQVTGCENFGSGKLYRFNRGNNVVYVICRISRR